MPRAFEPQSLRRSGRRAVAALPGAGAHPRSSPAISRERECELARRAQAGDARAARELVEANLRHVVAIAWNHRRYGVRVEDLVSEGCVGLMIALRKFDPDHGVRFVTYASHWVRACVLDHVVRTWSVVGLGSGPLRSKVFFRLRREKAKIVALTGDAVEAGERLAARFGTTPETIALLVRWLETRDASLDARVFADRPQTLLDTLAADAPSQEEQFLGRERATFLRGWVRGAIAKLDWRERFIVEGRLMTDSSDRLSLAEIGRRLGVSRERARQLETRAKNKIRRHLEVHRGDLATEAA